MRSYNKILFCGIGGSAVPGEVIKSLNLKKSVLIAREKLPASVNSKTLVFIVSYSGNTKETIKLYRQAKKKKARIIIITSGGRLGKVKDEKIFIAKGLMPRDAYVEMLLPILDTLNIKPGELRNIVKKASKIKAKRIAKKLKNKLPVVYVSSESLKVISDKWVDNLNEDSKILAHGGYFPEISHNEIEARLGKDTKVILLLDKQTNQIKRAKKILKPIVIKLKGNGLLEKIVYGIALGDLVSYYLAELLKRNYKVTKRIDYLKR